MRSFPLLLLAAFALLATSGKAQDHLIFLRDLRVEDDQKRIPVLSVSLPPSSMPFPAYPSELLRAGVMGEATLRFFVRENGSVSDVSVLAASRPEFGEAAQGAVTKWTYRQEFFNAGAARQTATNVWMRCRCVFKSGEEDGVPGYYPDFAHARMSGREVLTLALAAGEKEKIDLKEYSAPRFPMISVWGWERGLMWEVHWSKDTPDGGESVRVWIDDKTRETKLRRESWFGSGPDAKHLSSGSPLATMPSRSRGDSDLMILLRHPRAEEHQNDVVSSLSLPFPAYPGELIHAGVAGESTIRFLVGADGAVSEVSVVSASILGFGVAAKDAVARWKFEPMPQRANQAMPGIWMRSRFIFSFDPGTVGIVGGMPAFSDTSLSGHEAFALALACAKNETSDLKDDSWPTVPDTKVKRSGERLIWIFTWKNGKSRNDLTRVSIDDKTREASLEKGQEPNQLK